MLTSFVCAYFNIRDHYEYRQNSTLKRQFEELRGAIDEFHAKTGAYPNAPEELDSSTLEVSLIDPWRTRLIYRVEGDSYTLASLGYDGRPGGIGHDADRDSRIDPAFARPTLWQFTFELPTGTIWNMSGLAAFSIIMTSLTLKVGSRESMSDAWVLFPTVILMSVIGSFFLSAVHIPNGH